jgi:hypothetical protein
MHDCVLTENLCNLPASTSPFKDPAWLPSPAAYILAFAWLQSFLTYITDTTFPISNAKLVVSRGTSNRSLKIVFHFAMSPCLHCLPLPVWNVSIVGRAYFVTNAVLRTLVLVPCALETCSCLPGCHMNGCSRILQVAFVTGCLHKCLDCQSSQSYEILLSRTVTSILDTSMPRTKCDKLCLRGIS